MEQQDRTTKQDMVAIPFQCETSMVVAGPSQVGKTSFVLKLIKHKGQMYSPTTPDGILYCYSSEQSALDEAERTIPNFVLHRGLPTLETIAAAGIHPLVILDDLMAQALSSSDVTALFTKEVHHRHFTLIFIMQNVYEQGKKARSIALNTQYLVLFRNPRDVTQLMTLGKQMFPRQPQRIVEAMEDITAEDPRGYLIIDNTCTAKEDYRLRTKVFPQEDPILYTRV